MPNAQLPPQRRLSWFVELLPYLEQKALFDRIDAKAAWDAGTNASISRRTVRSLRCPDWERESTPADGLTPYVGCAGLGPDAAQVPVGHPAAGVFGYDRRVRSRDFKRGTANTLMILESAQENGPWTAGGPATVRGIDPASRPYLGTGRPFGGTHFAENSVMGHGKSLGCNSAMADGSVRFLEESISPDVLLALATLAGGEAVPADW